MIATVAAMALGGGLIAVVNGGAFAAGSQSVNCPTVDGQLPAVPQQAQAEVQRNLELLNTQIAEANTRLEATEGQGGANFVQNAILGPLESKRIATLDRIAISIGRAAEKPTNLGELATCTLKEGAAAATAAGDGQNNDNGQNNQNDGQNNQDDGQNNDNGAADDGAADDGAAGANPVAGGLPILAGPNQNDFVDITTVGDNVQGVGAQQGASTGTFSSLCGRNENGLFNPDNVIVAPGVSNGAHHMHDYVGNQANDAFATNESLAAADTSCSNGDKSTHYWPVVRLQNDTQEADAAADGGGVEGNIGEILTPATASITFQGSKVGQVVAMPQFLRIITGDAKALTNGTANANASWSCTGFEDKVQLKDKYPVCPQGSQVVRTFNFQSCWDGQNIDSANHRTHVAFAQADGSCANGFQAIPQLVQRITYDIPAGSVFAVDSFPEQGHSPVTDHGDFINVMGDQLMAEAVQCINTGQRCG